MEKNMEARRCIICGRDECMDPKCVALAEMRGGDKMEELLMRYCVEHVHEHLRKDNNMIELLCRICGCTEWELFSMFEGVARKGGYDLEHLL